MTKSHTFLFDPAKIQTTKKIAREVLQGKIPATALEEMFPIEVKMEPPKPEPEVLREDSPLSGAGVDLGEEKPVPETAATPPEDAPEEEQEEKKAAGEVAAPPEKLPESSKKPAYGDGAAHWKEFEIAVNLHRDGIDGNKEAVRECFEILCKILKMAPGNNLAEAYYGSATALMGRDAIDPVERFNRAIKGLKMLDRAVDKEPANTEIRILRAYVSYRLPEMYFHRTATAVEDFNYLASRFEDDPGVFSADFYSQVLYHLGKSYKNLGKNQEAEGVWQKLLTASKDTKYKELLRQEGLLPTRATESCGCNKYPVTVENVPQIRDEKKEELVQKGKELHRAALAGGSMESGKALQFFTKATSTYPGSPIIQAYYADCMSLAGRDSSDPGDMFANDIKAMKIFDGAVNSDPENTEVRMLRAYHSFRLPETFYRRTATAISDFEHLLKVHEESRSVLPEEAYRKMIYDLGIAYQRLGMKEEALSAWEKLMDEAPDSKYKSLVETHREDGVLRVWSDILLASSRNDLFEEGFRLHDMAMAGNRKAAEMALTLWEKVHGENDGDAMAQAYYGSCLALIGRDATDPELIFENIIKGLKLLNRAVSSNPYNHRIRLLRAYLTYSLPEFFFHLGEQAIKDLRYLTMADEQDSSVFSKEMYHQVLYNLGVAYQCAGDSPKAHKKDNIRALLRLD